MRTPIGPTGLGAPQEERLLIWGPLPHLAIFAFTRAANSSGELPKTSKPALKSRAFVAAVVDDLQPDLAQSTKGGPVPTQGRTLFVRG